MIEKLEGEFFMGKQMKKENDERTKEVVEKVKAIYKMIDELSEEMKEELGGELKENFVIVGPTMKPKTMLRIYAYGGDIGKLATNTGKSKVLREEYRKEGVYLTEAESLELESIICDEDKDEVLTNKKYLQLACRAAHNKFITKKDKNEKERNVEVQIVNKYMFVEDSYKWCIVDMEFQTTSTWFNREKRPKPDLVIFDRERKQLGLLELKYNNGSCISKIQDDGKESAGLRKHYKDFIDIKEMHDEINREIIRRIEYLLEYDLVNKSFEQDIREALGTVQSPKDPPVWFGFLLVGGSEDTYIEDTKSELADIKKIDADCRFLYVSDIEELKQTGLCYSQMKSIEEFLKG